MKKLFTAVIAVITVLCALLFAGCQTTNKTSAQKIEAGETVKIGVIQYLSHSSLDNCYAGIKQALDASGIKYQLDFQIGANATAEADCTTYAQTMVAGGCDIVIAIATPAAVKAYAAAADTTIPVIFCAVSDPIEARLVKDLATPGELCTGTSDVLDLTAQVNLIKALQPDVKTIGVIYTSSESNSVANLRTFKDVCSKSGITVDDIAIQNANDVSAAAVQLASRVDCINNFTDNNVVNNLNVVLNAANDNKIPVYGSEIEQVKKGCLAAVSIDYVALGKVTGEMAVSVLKGTDCTKLAVKTISDAVPVVNTDVLTALNIAMPEAYTNAETVTTNK